MLPTQTNLDLKVLWIKFNPRLNNECFLNNWKKLSIYLCVYAHAVHTRTMACVGDQRTTCWSQFSPPPSTQAVKLGSKCLYLLSQQLLFSFLSSLSSVFLSSGHGCTWERVSQELRPEKLVANSLINSEKGNCALDFMANLNTSS